VYVEFYQELIMETRVDEIADRIYRVSTFVTGIGLNFNQFLIDADQPMLFHTGQRSLFPSVSAAVARIIDLKRLKWITFSHVESDECGALDEWLAAAPDSTVAHGTIGCNTWLYDCAPRPPHVLANQEVLELGGKRVRHIDTPHVPHSWDAGLIFEETTRTLFSSDLLFQFGDAPPLASGDILAPALVAEERFRATPITAETPAVVRQLAALEPQTIAIMHGSSISGEVRPVLEGLAEYYERHLRNALQG
jgi:flavorubredoxin